jgi:hypothetical protein
MQTFATAKRASMVLAALLTPTCAPLAFPAALRFAARVLAEARGKPLVVVANSWRICGGPAN